MIYDFIVVGGGPAGISAAIEIKKKGLSPLVIDRGSLVNSIQNFPVNMIFFSTVDLLEIGDIPFVSASSHPTRVEAVRYYHRVASHYSIEFKTYTRVVSIRKDSKNSSFVVETVNELNSQLNFFRSKKIILATGFYDNPNRIGVQGEDMPNVSHYYSEPTRYFGQKVVVIGGKNSAVEAALELYRNGVDVTIIHRGSWFGKSVKYWILPDIENRVRNGQIKAFFDAHVKKITSDHIVIEQRREEIVLDCNYVLALTGYHPDINFLRSVGVAVDGNTGVPEFNPDTLESNIEGIYLAGSILAGYDCNKIFIENGREHGKIIAKNL
ncbi:MAG: YpdA family putative bacillithiol disulfide reductase [Candidatus Kryptoniota bacterium]